MPAGAISRAMCGAGSIAGTVQDQQGAVIAGATVNAVGVATGTKSSSKSDSQGYFEFKGLPIGSYSLTIEGPGFRKLHVSDVAVVAGIELEVVALQLGNLDLRGTAAEDAESAEANDRIDLHVLRRRHRNDAVILHGANVGDVIGGVATIQEKRPSVVRHG